MTRFCARLVLARSRVLAAVALLITLASVWGLGSVGFDISPSATITSKNQVTADLDRLHQEFGADDNDLVLILTGDHLLERETLQAARRLRDQVSSLAEIQHVASVFDLRRRTQPLLRLIPQDPGHHFDPNELLAELSKHPLAKEQLVSHDGRLLVFWARIEGGSLPVSTLNHVVSSTKRFVEMFEAKTGASVYLAGHTAVRADVLSSLQRAMVIGCSVAAVVAFLVSLILFLRIPPVLVVVAAPGLGTLWTFGLLGFCGVQVGGLLAALPNLILSIGLTDSVHLLLEMQRLIRKGHSRRLAVYRTLLRIGPACWLTSLTTVIGFGSLMLSRTDSISSFGMWAAAGTTLAVLANMFVLPFIVLLLPSRFLKCPGITTRFLTDQIQHLVAPTIRHGKLTALIGVACCMLLIKPALNQVPDIVWTEAIPQSADSVVAMQLADEQLGGALLCYVSIHWPERLQLPSREIIRATASVQNILSETPGFSGAFSVGNALAAVPGRTFESRFQLIRKMPETVQRGLFNEAARALVVTSRVPNDGAAALTKRVDQLESKLDTVRSEFPEFQFTVTGTVVAASQNMNTMIMELGRSLAVACVLIFLVLSFAFRSLRLGVLSVVPNVLPLLVTAAGLSLLGYPLQITSALTFSLCLGLAVDDTLHLLNRFHATWKYHPRSDQAAMSAVSHVAPALIVTTVILFSGFAAMLTSPLPSVRLFASLSALTLVTALVADLLFLPAMLAVGYRRNGNGR